MLHDGMPCDPRFKANVTRPSKLELFPFTNSVSPTIHNETCQTTVVSIKLGDIYLDSMRSHFWYLALFLCRTTLNFAGAGCTALKIC